MPTLTSSDLIYFAAFVVPGFISMQVYSQIRPRGKITLKDNLLEALSFGVINFILLFFSILWVVNPVHFQQYPLFV